MQPCIQVDIFLLIVVLDKRGKEKFIGKCYIDPRSKQPEIRIAPGLRQIDTVVYSTHRNTYIRLKAITQIDTCTIPAAIGIVAAEPGCDRIGK